MKAVDSMIMIFLDSDSLHSSYSCLSKSAFEEEVDYRVLLVLRILFFVKNVLIMDVDCRTRCEGMTKNMLMFQ